MKVLVASNKVLCNNGTYDITNGAVAPCFSAGGVKQQSFDWAKLGKNVLNNQGFPDTSNVTSTPVLCKDGTTKIQKSFPNAEYMDVCVNNGGRAVNQPVVEIPQFKTPTQQEPVSDLEYYTSANFLKRASVSIIPVGLIGAYCYHKKFSLLKSGLLISIPIVAITGLQYIGMGGGKNKYWGIFTPPSIRANQLKKIQLIEQQTGVPQKIK